MSRGIKRKSIHFLEVWEEKTKNQISVIQLGLDKLYNKQYIINLEKRKGKLVLKRIKRQVHYDTNKFRVFLLILSILIFESLEIWLLTYMKITISLCPRDLEYTNVLNPRLVSLKITHGKIRIWLEIGCKLETLDKENNNAFSPCTSAVCCILKGTFGDERHHKHWHWKLNIVW